MVHEWWTMDKCVDDVVASWLFAPWSIWHNWSNHDRTMVSLSWLNHGGSMVWLQLLNHGSFAYVKSSKRKNVRRTKNVENVLHLCSDNGAMCLYHSTAVSICGMCTRLRIPYGRTLVESWLNHGRIMVEAWYLHHCSFSMIQPMVQRLVSSRFCRLTKGKVTTLKKLRFDQRSTMFNRGILGYQKYYPLHLFTRVTGLTFWMSNLGRTCNLMEVPKKYI